ncbi:hypothetical protein PO909_003932, partial [Leuciscus waleckii]
MHNSPSAPCHTASAPATSSAGAARSASRARRVCTVRTTVIVIATLHPASTLPPKFPMNTSTSSNIPSGIRQSIHHTTVAA